MYYIGLDVPFEDMVSDFPERRFLPVSDFAQ